jgi:hypothetical protein
MQVFCFEDSLVDRLRPAVLARPTYAVTCGSYRLIDWLKRIGTEVFAEVRPYLRELQKLDFAIASPTAIAGGQSVLIVNARLAPTVANLRRLESAIASAGDVIHRDDVDDAVLFAKLTIPAGPVTTLGTLIEEAQASKKFVVDDQTDVYRWPHDLVEIHMRSMPSAMEYRVQTGNYQQLQDGVFVADGVQIGQYAAFDTSEGPVVLDSNVKVGPLLLGTRVRGAFDENHRTCGAQRRRLSGTHGQDRWRSRSVRHRALYKQTTPWVSRPQLFGKLDQLGRGHLQQRLEKYLRQDQRRVWNNQDGDRHAVFRMHHGRLQQDGDQHQRLHRQDHRSLQHDVRIRHLERSQLCQLRTSVRTNIPVARRRDDFDPGTNVRPAESPTTSQ